MHKYTYIHMRKYTYMHMLLHQKKLENCKRQWLPTILPNSTSYSILGYLFPDFFPFIMDYHYFIIIFYDHVITIYWILSETWSGVSSSFLCEALPYLVQLPIISFSLFPWHHGQITLWVKSGIISGCWTTFVLIQLFSWWVPYLCQRDLNIK
jgi:hypothetical protein